MTRLPGPRHCQALGYHDRRKENDAEEAQPHERGPGEWTVELRIGGEQQVAEPVERADELPDHRTDDSERHRDLGAGEDERQRRWELNLQKNLQRRGT